MQRENRDEFNVVILYSEYSYWEHSVFWVQLACWHSQQPTIETCETWLTVPCTFFVENGHIMQFLALWVVTRDLRNAVWQWDHQNKHQVFWLWYGCNNRKPLSFVLIPYPFPYASDRLTVPWSGMGTSTLLSLPFSCGDLVVILDLGNLRDTGFQAPKLDDVW